MRNLSSIASALLISLTLAILPAMAAGKSHPESMTSGLFIRQASLTAVFPDASGSGNPLKQDPPQDARLDPVDLVLDDGTNENNIGVGGTQEFLWLNRFTPDPASFPFTLNQIQVYFETEGLVNIGDDIQLVIYENTSGNTDPAVGSTWLVSFPETVSVLDAWSVYDLPAPIQFNGPGDVLLGVIAMEIPGTSYWPAGIDQTATQQRSWVGWWETSPPPDPPVLPPTNWVLIDTYFPGNWMIRGYGESGSEPTPTPTPPPTSTPPPTGTPTAPFCVNSGDVNLDGELTSSDAQSAFYIVLGLFTPTPIEFCAAYCNADLNVTAGDAQLIFLAVLGLGNCDDPI